MSESLLFFDLDDTLLDHRTSEGLAQQETFDAHASLFGSLAFEEWLPAYRRRNVALWEAFGRRAITREELCRRRFEEPLGELGLDATRGASVGDFYLAAYERHWRLFEGACEALEEASRLGIVGILSNGFTWLQKKKVKRFGLDRWVRHVVLSEEVGVSKPAREIFDAAVRMAGGGGASVRKVYVGDQFECDVLGAKSAGWFPIFFNPRGEPLPSPAVFVTRLSDLSPLLA
jgi:putative hydrolase of the HAD superfamily